MNRRKNMLLDVSLIFVGLILSILFISTDGNGQNPIPVAGHMLIFVLVNGLISLLLARIIDELTFEIIISIILTDLLFIVYAVRDLAFHSTDKYAAEAASLFPVVFTVYTAPCVLLSSIGFGRMASRYWNSKKTSAKEEI